jgi:hypothetical protein
MLILREVTTPIQTDDHHDNLTHDPPLFEQSISINKYYHFVDHMPSIYHFVDHMPSMCTSSLHKQYPEIYQGSEYEYNW